MPKDVTITWRGAGATKKIRAAALQGLGIYAELLLQKARALVPLDEGVLERSGTPSTDAKSMTAAVSFDTPYAVRQHEEETWRHAPGREAKYLERPWIESAHWALQIIAKQIRKATAK